jgi:hypothetical protein
MKGSTAWAVRARACALRATPPLRSGEDIAPPLRNGKLSTPSFGSSPVLIPNHRLGEFGFCNLRGAMTKRTRSKISKRLKATAIHEAGHAVIARVLTLVCGSATIKADHNSTGHSLTHDPWTCIYEWERRGKVRHPDAVWHARMIGFMASAEAERELIGSVLPGDGDDRHQIELMAEKLDNVDSWERLEPRLRAMTRALVRRHRARIEAVAEALIARKTLSREELDTLSGRSVDDVKINAPDLLRMAAMRNSA